METILIGTPHAFSMNSTYFRQFSGSSSYDFTPRMSHFQPGSFTYTVFCAGAVIVAIPVVLLFIRMQKYYVAGVVGGSVKG